MNCLKCRERRVGEWGESLRMIGGYNTRLCSRCKNAFHEYIRDLPEFLEIDAVEKRCLDIVTAATGRHDPGPELEPLRARARALDRALYEIGKAWVEAPDAMLAGLEK